MIRLLTALFLLLPGHGRIKDYTFQHLDDGVGHGPHVAGGIAVRLGLAGALARVCHFLEQRPVHQLAPQHRQLAIE